MIEICRDSNLAKIGMLRSVLEEARIPAVNNEFNIGITEIPIPNVFPALCVIHVQSCWSCGKSKPFEVIDV